MINSKYHSGFSLIELLVAMLLGAILLLGITQVFLGNKQSNTMQQSYARLQEGGRTAMELLIRDIRMADNWGCFRQRGKISNHLDTSDTDYVDWLTPAAVDGTDNASASLPTIGGKQVLAGTDTLSVITTLDICGGKGRVVSAAAGKLAVSTTCTLSAGQAAVVSNCEAAELFTITAFDTSSGEISHDTTYNTGKAIKNTNTFAASSPAYGFDAKLLAPIQRRYFVAQGSNSSPSLFRCDNNCSAADELVPGVENMQIEFGEDTNGDGIVDIYHSAGSVADKGRINSVRITLTLRGTDLVNLKKDNAPYNDGLLRKTLVAIADIRNRSLN